MSTKRENVVYKIVGGPNRDKMFDALKYAFDKHPLPINLVVTGYKTNQPINLPEIRVNGIEHEDGSGSSFNLYGYCKADLHSVVGSIETCKSYKFNAYYNTRSRTGSITFSS